MIFENLFAVYCKLSMAQSRFWKKNKFGILRSNEDFNAAALLALIQVQSVMVAVGWIIKKLDLSNWILLLCIPLLVYLIYLNNKVFVKDRKKRMAILDNYNNLSVFNKFVWIFFSIVIFIMPLYLFLRVINS